MGLGNANMKQQYFAPAANQPNKGTGSFVEGYNSGLEPSLHLQVVKGDDYLSGLNLDKIDFVKIDVEGFEQEVLSGMGETLRRFRPVIAMEFSEKTFEKIQSLDRLKALLPPNYIIREIRQANGKHLQHFHFETSRGDILCFDETTDFLNDF
ncbi:MAG: hypothetical protein OHK0019_31410 [Saprospiraceae bacterium]